MVQVSFLTPSGVPGKYTKHAYLVPEAIEKLLGLLLTPTPPPLSETTTCLRNPNQCCVTSSECSLTKIQFSSTPHVEVEVHCERLSRLALSIVLDSRSMTSSPGSLETPSKRRGRSAKQRKR